MKQFYLPVTGLLAFLLVSSSCHKVGPERITTEHKVEVTTLAGSGGMGYSDDENGPSAGFGAIFSIALDAGGNVYVADADNSCIRKVTPTGAVTTIAGDGTAGEGFQDGTGAAARFDHPRGITVDASGNVYVADSYNHSIRKITPAGVVTTFAGNGTAGYADGPGATARFVEPNDLACDAAGNIYVADKDNHCIRKITPAGIVSTIAGSRIPGYANGPVATAMFNKPTGVAVDASGNIYVGDRDNYRIRKIAGGVVSLLAGNGSSLGSFFADGKGTAASAACVSGLGIDASGNVYFSELSRGSPGGAIPWNLRVRKITPGGVVTTIAGKKGSEPGSYADGLPFEAMFSYPSDVAVDASGNVYVADLSNPRIRKIIYSTIVTTPKNIWNNPRSWGNPHDK